MKLTLSLFCIALTLLFSRGTLSQNPRLAARIASDAAISDQLRKEGVKYETKRAIVWTSKDGLSAKELEDFAKLVDKGIIDIEKYTGIKFDKKHYKTDKIEWFVSSAPGISRGSLDGKPHIYLSTARVRGKTSSYLHEATHKLAYKINAAMWMAEGFSSYIHTYVASGYGGNGASVHNRDGVDIHQLARGHLKSDVGKNLLPLIGANGTPHRMDAEQAAKYRPIIEDRVVTAPAFYNLSESFVTFLVAKIGLKKVIKVFDSADMEANILKITGRNVDEWKAEWRSSLF